MRPGSPKSRWINGDWLRMVTFLASRCGAPRRCLLCVGEAKVWRPLIISASHGAPDNFRSSPNIRHSLALQYLSQRAKKRHMHCNNPW